MALWHERDMSLSGAERVILPDSLILIDYMQSLAVRVVRGMVVHEDRMLRNLDLTSGALFSQRVLLAHVDSGLQRDHAYRIVQETQRAWDAGPPRRDLLGEQDLRLDIDAMFDLRAYNDHADEIVGRVRVLHTHQ